MSITARAGDKSDRMRHIIENVRSNEALYKDIEVVETKSYHANASAQMPSKALTGDVTKSRYVMQQGKLYSRMEEKGQTAGNSGIDRVSLLGFDGQYTRTRGGDTANVHEGKMNTCKIFQPHTWLLSHAHLCFPLSLYLDGDKAIATHPLAGAYANITVRCSFARSEEIDGLRCCKLVCEMCAKKSPPEPYAVRYVWLAEDRNYLPIKAIGFQFGYSKDIPLESASASDFREISPGIWLPFKRSLVVNDEFQAKKNQKTVVSNTEEELVEKAELDPRYGIELFRDIPVSDAPVVYDVKDGKIIRTRITQNPHPAATHWAWYIPIVVLVLIALGIGVRFFKKRNA